MPWIGRGSGRLCLHPPVTPFRPRGHWVSSFSFVVLLCPAGADQRVINCARHTWAPTCPASRALSFLQPLTAQGENLTVCVLHSWPADNTCCIRFLVLTRGSVGAEPGSWSVACDCSVVMFACTPCMHSVESSYFLSNDIKVWTASGFLKTWWKLQI